VVRRDGKFDAFANFSIRAGAAAAATTFPWHRLSGGLLVVAAVLIYFALTRIPWVRGACRAWGIGQPRQRCAPWVWWCITNPGCPELRAGEPNRTQFGFRWRAATRCTPRIACPATASRQGRWASGPKTLTGFPTEVQVAIFDDNVVLPVRVVAIKPWGCRTDVANIAGAHCGILARQAEAPLHCCP